MTRKPNRDGELPTKSQPDAHIVALEFLKQLITLSSGVLAVSAAFIENFHPQSRLQVGLLIGSWACLAGSAYFGLQAISTIVQIRLIPDLDWRDSSGLKFATFSNHLFVAGITLFAAFALASFLFTAAP
jgi:hypothetical protein